MQSFRFSLILLSPALFVSFGAADARAGAYMPSPELLGSPALLQDYVSWDHAYTAFRAPGSETAAYADLVEIVYDHEIDRPWGSAYFPEAEKRLEAFRSLLCPPLEAPKPRICSSPEKMAANQDVTDLSAALSEDALILTLQQRWGTFIEAASLPNAPRTFNLEVGNGNATEASVSYWNLSPTRLAWLSLIPMITDVDTYRAGFDFDGDFAGQFALARNNIVLNDWRIRDRAMTFASVWKFNIDFDKKNPPTNPATQAEELLDQALYDANQENFQAAYQELLPKAQANAKTLARFQKERAQGGFPEEAYQLVAYRLLGDLVRVQSAYYKLAETQRLWMLDRSKALEALLTIQRYGSSWQAFLVELETLAMPFTTHATVLDQTANFSVAIALSTEELNVILGLGAYANTDYINKYRYAIAADELFNADYLKANQTNIYKELLKPDGQLTKLSELSDADQARFLREYMQTPDGQPNIFGISRMSSVFRVRIHGSDLRDIADIVHAAHAKDFR